MLVINNIEVNLTSKNGQVFTTSLEVAKVFEKNHKEVIRDIRNLMSKDERKIAPMFIEREYKDTYSRSQPFYEMTRDGFTLLAMGFTGDKALEWKLAYINGFNKMEQALKQPSLFEIPQTFSDALLLAANQAKQIEKQTKVLEYQKPRVEFADRLLKSEGTLSLRDYAKLLCDKGLQIGQNRLFEKLKELDILDNKNKPYQRYVDMGVLTLKEATYKNSTTGDDVIYSQVRVTAKGQEYLYKRIAA
ncbi:MAG: phage regulatory protein/antirepressor Ant [Campylobacteraceae bacterium]|jgi:anti-repressor protein|nr:phage regulatory protein/antirepressor Ant [Campylobacteraceae bacterium]